MAKKKSSAKKAGSASKSSSRKAVTIYTDGACSGNPGPGGFAAILRHGKAEGARSGAHPQTTNNQMELMAVIAGLESLKEPCDVEVWTDSRYVHDGITQWIHGWKRNGWKNKDKKPVKNAELWRRLDRARDRHDVSWHWVKGHAGHEENELADELAREAIDMLRDRKLLPVDLGENPTDPAANVRVTSGPIAAKASAPKKKTTKKKANASGASNTPGAGRDDADRDRPAPRPVDREVVLASTSPYRRHLMERLRIEFHAANPRIDEDAIKDEGYLPDDLVMHLALTKAGAVARNRPDSIVIACDQAPALGEDVLGKPGTAKAAVEQLMQLRGTTHRLLTALVVHDGRSGRTERHLDVHEMTMRQLTKKQIERYVTLDQPLDCSGSYRFESLGAALFESVSGEDVNAIVGLPLIRLVQILADMGVDVLGV